MCGFVFKMLLLTLGIHASDASVQPHDASACGSDGARGSGPLGELTVAGAGYAMGRYDLYP